MVGWCDISVEGPSEVICIEILGAGLECEVTNVGEAVGVSVKVIVGRLIVDEFMGELAAKSVGELFEEFVGELVGESVGELVEELVGELVGELDGEGVEENEGGCETIFDGLFDGFVDSS